MKISKYYKYLRYILEHKWFVLIECWKEGLYWQGITHDLSKFSPLEFYAYSWHFYAAEQELAGSGNKYKKKFSYAWLHHLHRNKHHWNYWVVDSVKKEALPMPEKYILEMICDWRAMSRKFGNDPREYIEKHWEQMILHPETAKIVAQKMELRVSKVVR